MYIVPDGTSGLLAYMELGVVLCNTSFYLYDRSFMLTVNHSYCIEFTRTP